jgi:RNA polymerase sigma-70 factor (ECF subfamily)
LVYKWCRQFGLQPADAADVGQEVFQLVARHICRFQKKSGTGTFRGWLRVITSNQIAEVWSARNRPGTGLGGEAAERQLQNVPARVTGPIDEEDDSQEVGLLCNRAAMLIEDEFTPNTWQAFWSLVVDKDSPEKVALQLGMTRSAVYSAKARVIRRLREEFGELVE